MTVLLLILAAAAAPDAYMDTYTSAGKAYDAGDYAGAIGMYEQLVNESVSNPAVYYNLGNAYYRKGDLGGAIANYERALALDPRMDQARHNLEKAVRDTKQKLARPLPPDWEQSLLFWHYGISKQLTFVLAGLLWIALWTVLGLRQWRPIPHARAAAAILAILAVAFGSSAWKKAHPTPLAVAAADPTPVRYGTSDDETVRFNLYPGDRVNIDGRAEGWVRVTTADGERGWAESSQMIFVWPTR